MSTHVPHSLPVSPPARHSHPRLRPHPRGGLRACLLLALVLLLPLRGGGGPATLHAQPADAASADALALARQLEQHITATIARLEPTFVRVGPGSGILISPDGYALTNYHVTEDNHFNVSTGDGRSFRATNIGQDPRGDIVLLKLDTRETLPYVELADSDAVQPGHLALALGNPFLYARDDPRPAAVLGIVSAVHRYQQGYADTIQTDARLNPGNSGGPLLTLDGRLIGINGRIGVRRTFGTRINTGVGYAIPSNQIARFVRAMRERGGLVRHGLIDGLRIAPEATGGRGVTVASVAVGTDAATAGFQVGDRIVEIDGRPAPSPNRFWGVIGTYPEGWRLPLLVERGGQRVVLHATLAPTSTLDQRSEIPAAPRGNEPDLRLPPPLGPVELPEFAPLRPAYLGVVIDAQADRDTNGCPIERVIPNSPAARAGLRPGDVVISARAIPLRTAADLRQIVATSTAGERLRLEYKRRWFGFWRTYTATVTLAAHPRDPGDQDGGGGGDE